MTSTQRHASELTHEVGFLGRERCASVNRNGVFAMLLLDLAHAADGEGESLVPSRGSKPFFAAHQRRKQTIRMVALKITFHSFRAKHATVEGKLFPGLKTDDAILPNLQLDSALLPAETAVRLH